MSAISFKTLTSDDMTTSRTLLHESIPITGTLVSGTYATASTGRENNIKTFSHGMFQSVYDYPYASSSANHIFDITSGFSAAAESLSGSGKVQVSKKVNLYNQMAMQLAGYDTNGNIRKFDFDGDHSTDAGKAHNLHFINFSRLLVKDEIKKGSFELKLGSFSSSATPFATTTTLTDADSVDSYRSNSPAGEYGFVKDGSTTVGLIYYQAGIVVLSGSVLDLTGTEELLPSGTVLNGVTKLAEDVDHLSLFTSATVDQSADALRRRIKNISFNNTTELNSTIYFCRAHKGEFNYSSNPTYLSGSKIRVKTIPGSGNEFQNPPMAYVTTVGLYSPDNELLAVAKLSEPVKKTPINELNFRVRLDY